MNEGKCFSPTTAFLPSASLTLSQYVMAKYFHAASCISMIPLRLGDLVDYAANTWGGNEAVSFPFQNIMKTFNEVKADVSV